MHKTCFWTDLGKVIFGDFCKKYVIFSNNAPLPAPRLQIAESPLPPTFGMFFRFCENGRGTTTIFENLGKCSQTQPVYFLGCTTCVGLSEELPATPTPTLAFLGSGTPPCSKTAMVEVRSQKDIPARWIAVEKSAYFLLWKWPIHI